MTDSHMTFEQRIMNCFVSRYHYWRQIWIRFSMKFELLRNEIRFDSLEYVGYFPIYNLHTNTGTVLLKTYILAQKF